MASWSVGAAIARAIHPWADNGIPSNRTRDVRSASVAASVALTQAMTHPYRVSVAAV